MGCASISPNIQTSLPPSSTDVAVLSDYELKNGFITIRTIGNGCTFFDSFRVEVEDLADNELKVVRTRPDNCAMKKRTVSLQYSFKHLGLDLEKQIKVSNPTQPSLEPKYSSF